jgi:ABC-type multidrug transport system ATPase subunit
MEEADVLCTRIGIVATGQLICIGSQLRLKRRFGDGFRLKVALATAAGVKSAPQISEEHSSCTSTQDEDEVERLCNFVQREVCDQAKLVHQFKNQLTFMLPRDGMKISVLFDKFTSAQAELNVREWSVNQTSLEEVFIKLVEQHDEMVASIAAAATAPTLRWSSS